MRCIQRLVRIAPLLAAAALPAHLYGDQAELAASGVAIVNKYCVSCHSGPKPKSNLRLDTAAGFRAAGESGDALYVEGKLDESLLWIRVGIDGEMPPDGKPQPTAAEREQLKAWLLAGAPYPDEPQAAANEWGPKAFAVFQKHCVSCHGQQFKAPGLDFRKLETLTRTLPGQAHPHVIAGEPEQSLLWKKAVEKETMPPASRPGLSVEEKQIVTQWIAAGAPAFGNAPSSREFVSRRQVYAAIRDHLKATRRADRRKQRYFSFVELHNNPNVYDEELNLYKAALSKLINSLHQQPDIVVPRPIDPHQTVYAVDLSEMRWSEEDQWSPIMSKYPYLVSYDTSREGAALARDVADIELDVLQMSGSSLPQLYVRADWFVAVASRPPLYHTLLELPETTEALEKSLRVTVIEDFLNGNLARGGVIRSGISTQNRVMDRHRAIHGSYWKSYDFKTNTDDHSALRNPLGPKFEGNSFNDNAAFVHDGGEMIFSLPDGMQGYFLTDADGKRIDKGPIEIVRDSNETSGSPVVVNGLSCMACHKNGVRPFQDELAQSLLVGSGARAKVNDLFREHEQMDDLLKKDERRFLVATLQAVEPFLPVTNVNELRDFTEEPIQLLARRYHQELDAATVAAELGFPNSEQLQRAFGANFNAGRILGPVTRGGVIKRADWDTRPAEGRNTNFQTVASELGKGIPLKPN